MIDFAHEVKRLLLQPLHTSITAVSNAGYAMYASSGSVPTPSAPVAPKSTYYNASTKRPTGLSALFSLAN